MKNKNLKYLVIGLFIIFVIVSIICIIVSLRETPEETPSRSIDMNSVIEQANETTNYEFTMTGIIDKNELGITATCNTIEHSVKATITDSTEEDTNNTIKYTFPTEGNFITQEIIYEDEILATNSLEQPEEIDISTLDTSKLLSFFANHLNETLVCGEESCNYIMYEDDLVNLFSYLSTLTFGKIEDYTLDLENLSMDYYIDESLKITKIKMNYLDKKQLEFNFVY